MIKNFFLTLCCCCALMGRAQVVDAFQDILPVTDPSMKQCLNGTWQLKVIEGVGQDTSVPVADDSWGTIPVPGCWEAYGFCKPKYDSPNPLTGYYRTSFSVPERWKGQRIVIRFDGVLYGYDLWINGKQAGSWRSGYNTAMFDITNYLTKGNKQELALRVISQFPGSDFDYNDDWAPNGIIRDVTLMAVPKTHLSDLTIQTTLNGDVKVETKIANGNKATVVSHEILDAQGRVVGENKVEHPYLWTAETPYLYTLRTTLAQKGRTLQTFEHKFGFRKLTIDGNILKLNGQPIKLRGVTSHSTDPKTVKVIDEASILRDMRLMKEASINYIRTSHYPREPRFYELADSLGFYVIDEVPFGYGDKNLYDSTFYQVLQQRAQATIRRDKNHPSVLIWSLGNENPLTDICIKLGDYVKQTLDSSRPICYPQVGSYFRKFNYDFPKVADIYAPHYPTTGQIADFYQKNDRPVIFTEYCHTLGISLEDHDRQWEIIERTPGIAGGSVWEWVDQGMPFKANMKDHYGYEERVFISDKGGFEMFGNKGTDGLLYADRTPLPNYYELQHNYARAFVVDGSVSCNTNAIYPTIAMTLQNRYDFLNLKDNVTFNWSVSCEHKTIANGAFSPDCAPHSTTPYSLTLPTHFKETDLVILHIDIADAQDHHFLQQSFVLNKPADVNHGELNHGDRHPSAIKDSTVVPAPMIRVGRKPTMAERLKADKYRIAKYLQPVENPYVKATIENKGPEVAYSLKPDTAHRFLAELGVAYLLDARIDRVQWLGYGPLASYPGRQKANRYGLWALHKDDLYFEGNRMNIDAVWASDAEGRGVLIQIPNGGCVNFEQTDQGIVLTVNAIVSGQGPKFSMTAFPVWGDKTEMQTGSFLLFPTEVGQIPQHFKSPSSVPVPFKPFLTQYDTYLMRFQDIREW